MIIGTGGHIDHGKTALVRALTGVETDRLPEERRRGITIALGFAPLELPGLGLVGVVDVPGHEAFVRTMLAGASGIDAALLVVAADEGVMPQTREHLEVFRLLGVSRGVVALTKIDAVDDEMRALVTLDVEELLAGSSLQGAPIVPVSARTGAGLEGLRAALGDVLARVPAREPDAGFRLPVDRAFSVAGAGTVVTGTTWSGTASVGDSVRILPAGRIGRVRSIQSHGAEADSTTLGARTALALAGLERADVGPGSVVLREDEAWEQTQVLRADVALVPGAASLGVRSRVRFHLGTSECGARVIVQGGRVEPGVTRPARLVLDAPLLARAGDRFVLRGGSPHTTIGGGVVTDPLPGARRARPWEQVEAAPRERLLWMLAEAATSGVPLASLPQRLGIPQAAIERLLKGMKGVAQVDGRLLDTAVLERLRRALLSAVERAHREQPLAPGLDRQTARAALRVDDRIADEVLRRAERAGLIESAGAALRMPGFDPSATAGAGDAKGRLLAELERAGVEPPSVAELEVSLGRDVQPLLKLLEREGLVVAIALDRRFARSAVVALLDRLRSGTEPGRLYAPAELREMLGVTRKYLIPFLEWCDRQGISRRSDNGRSFPSIPANP